MNEIKQRMKEMLEKEGAGRPEQIKSRLNDHKGRENQRKA